ncbi:Uncharacterised protein [Mycobacteroides abscessus subsp. abscessus]|nr:Uncharacterised protein [Mycobacteroides abscessus]SHU69671.1 Uncharacterised protein [Mycobacteroides abscessus subsp. abscessus]SKT95025.1 Uncharacterised protein [Mycobacteroides abscessus subsp. abscessus]
MYSSPTTPGGTGRSSPSSTNIAAPGTGAPIDGDPVPPTNAAVRDAQIVVSVGP